MRDKIAAELWRTQAIDAGAPPSVANGRTLESFASESPGTRASWLKYADAILAALPGMVPELVWDELQEDRGDGSADDTGDYESGDYLIEIGFGSDAYCWAVSFSGDFISSHDDPDTAKAAANAHHRAAIAKAAGWTT